MPCSAMMRAASWASASRTCSARLEFRRGMSVLSEERFVVLVVFVRRARIGIILTRLGGLRQVAFDENLENPVRIVAAGDFAGGGRNAHRHQSSRHRAVMFRHTLQSLEHEVRPGRHRRAATFLAGAERAFVVESDPYRRDEIRREAAEPRIVMIVRGPGLASQVSAAE